MGNCLVLDGTEFNQQHHQNSEVMENKKWFVLFFSEAVFMDDDIQVYKNQTVPQMETLHTKDDYQIKNFAYAFVQQAEMYTLGM